MADIKYDFAADVTAAERAIARLEQKTEKLENANKQLSRTSKRGSDDFVSGASRMLTNLVSVTAAVGVVTRAYGQWQDRIDKLAQSQEKFNDKLTASLVGSGMLAQGPRIRSVLNNLPGVTPEQGEAVFAGITTGAPELTPAQVERATRDFSRAAPLYTTFDEQGLLQGAENLQNISRLRGRFESLLGGRLSADDVSDVTLMAHQMAGGRAEQLTQPGAQTVLGMLTDQGMSDDRALGFMTEFVQEGIEMGTARGIVGKAAGAGLTMDDLFAMDPAKRRKFLGDERDDLFARLEQADVDANARTYQQGRERDVLNQELARLESARLVEQRTAYRKERFDRADSQYENALDKVADKKFQDLRYRVPGIDYIPGARFGVEMMERTAQTFLEPAGLVHTPQEQVAMMAAQQSANEQLRKQDETNRLLKDIADKLAPPRARDDRRPLNRGAHVEGVPLGGTAGF